MGGINFGYGKTYCDHFKCKFKSCEKHISQVKKHEGYLNIASFSGVCRKYITWLVQEMER